MGGGGAFKLGAPKRQGKFGIMTPTSPSVTCIAPLGAEPEHSRPSGAGWELEGESNLLVEFLETVSCSAGGVQLNACRARV